MERNDTPRTMQELLSSNIKNWWPILYDYNWREVNYLGSRNRKYWLQYYKDRIKSIYKDCNWCDKFKSFAPEIAKKSKEDMKKICKKELLRCKKMVLLFNNLL